MDFVFQEMWLCLLHKKAPLYAPYVMKLIVAVGSASPLVSLNLVEHKLVRLQKKIAKKQKKRSDIPFIDDEEEIDEMDEDEMEDSPRGPRIKNASNAFVPSSQAFVQRQMKKMPWWKKALLCMNIDIRHGQYEAYKTNRQILENTRRPPRTPQEIEASEGTLSYGAWNRSSSAMVNWADFEDISSAPSSSRDKGKQAAADDEDDDGESGSGSGDYSGSGSGSGDEDDEDGGEDGSEFEDDA
jgi:hypothetical protein